MEIQTVVLIKQRGKKSTITVEHHSHQRAKLLSNFLFYVLLQIGNRQKSLKSTFQNDQVQNVNNFRKLKSS